MKGVRQSGPRYILLSYSGPDLGCSAAASTEIRGGSAFLRRTEPLETQVLSRA